MTLCWTGVFDDINTTNYNENNDDNQYDDDLEGKDNDSVDNDNGNFVVAWTSSVLIYLYICITRP